ncbi:hypothetical protein ACSBR2_034064 [Camellia fascicularis]
MEEAGVELIREDSERGLFLEELEHVAFRWDVPWCVGGYFNVVRWPSEKAGNARSSGAMRAFCSFIDDLQLVDLPIQGGSFTWSNGRSLSRIDRFLVTMGWEEHFSEVVQLRLPRPVSDHWPILLDSGGSAVGLRYFGLRICGCNMRVFSTWFVVGGIATRFVVLLVVCWLKN